MAESKASHWYYRGERFKKLPEGQKNLYGFVYLISNLSENKYYIGKKIFFTNRKKYYISKYSGKKCSKRVRSESNWRVYTGSNKKLNEDLERLGKSEFSFQILGFAYTKGQLNYLEENTQHKMNALTDVRFYNDAVGNSHFRNLKINGDLRDSIHIIEENIENREPSSIINS